MMQSPPKRISSVVLLCLVLSGAGCKEEAAAPRPAPPSPKVSVVEARAERIPVVSELPGRVAPMVTAEVRPRVTGIVLRRSFEQGSTVRAGDLLYVVDPEPFHARVASARAAHDSAVAGRELAQQRANRQTQLLQRGVASQETADSAIAALAQSNADVERTRADLRMAELELQYTEVRSPIRGTIGRALVTEGALVSPTSDVLTIIQQIDPVYVDFTQPADRLIALRSAVADGRLEADDSGSARLRLLSADGRPYPHDGRLLFSEASVNAATGQVILRGEFPNPDQNLLPGMYVRGRIEQAALEGAIAVPAQAVQRDTAGRALLYIVNNDDKVELRTVSLGWAVGGRRVIMNGITSGDRVVVEGFQRITPGARVSPEPWMHSSAGATSGRNGG